MRLFGHEITCTLYYGLGSKVLPEEVGCFLSKFSVAIFLFSYMLLYTKKVLLQKSDVKTRSRPSKYFWLNPNSFFSFFINISDIVSQNCEIVLNRDEVTKLKHSSKRTDKNLTTLRRTSRIRKKNKRLDEQIWSLDKTYFC